MPIYEYQCQACQKITEKMQKFSDSPLVNCPECNGQVEKLLSLTSFSLKGNGWYVTDYKKSSAPATTTPKAQADATPATTQGNSEKTNADQPKLETPKTETSKTSTSGNSSAQSS